MSLKDTYCSAWEALPVTIVGGDNTTSNINLGGFRLFGIVMPSAWTAANLSFQASFDQGATWHDLKDASGAEITVIAGADDCVVWLPAAFASLQMLKVRSGSSALPVSQTADRILQLILRGV